MCVLVSANERFVTMLVFHFVFTEKLQQTFYVHVSRSWTHKSKHIFFSQPVKKAASFHRMKTINLLMKRKATERKKKLAQLELWLGKKRNERRHNGICNSRRFSDDDESKRKCAHVAFVWHHFLSLRKFQNDKRRNYEFFKAFIEYQRHCGKLAV